MKDFIVGLGPENCSTAIPQTNVQNVYGCPVPDNIGVVPTKAKAFVFDPGVEEFVEEKDVSYEKLKRFIKLYTALKTYGTLNITLSELYSKWRDYLPKIIDGGEYGLKYRESMFGEILPDKHDTYDFAKWLSKQEVD